MMARMPLGERVARRGRQQGIILLGIVWALAGVPRPGAEEAPPVNILFFSSIDLASLDSVELIEAVKAEILSSGRRAEIFAESLDLLRLPPMPRHFDGAYPSIQDPQVLWEIKEYYDTKTFGSRVADGVYESLLDGMEMEETERSTQTRISHYLIVDSRTTWWKDGKSYLCRLIDMLNMGYVDVLLFGKEVATELPALVKNEWTLPGSR